MAVPKKLLLRKDEITADFMKLIDWYMGELQSGRIGYLFHAKHFAGLLFIHPRHLSNTIKLTTGKSPCDFMEERLTNEAKKMLLETDLSIADIGAALAYKDATNFTKFFKGMAGMTPSQYRKTHRELAVAAC